MNITDFYPFIIHNDLGEAENNNMCPSDLVCLDSVIKMVEKPGMVVYEIGSWTGMSTCCLGEIVKKNNGRLFSVDNFKGSPGSNQVRFNNARIALEKNIKKFGIEDYTTILEGNSDDFYKDVDDESVDMVFIDADHRYSQVKKDLDNWFPKVKVGGVISGHDFNSTEWDEEHIEKDFIGGKHHGVIKAVAEKFGTTNLFLNPNTYEMVSSVWYLKKEK